MKHLFKLTAFACMVLSSLAFRQVSAPKPGEELKRLEDFIGTWTLEGEFKAGILGPAEKVSGTDRYEWMEGGYFLAGHSNFKSADGTGSSLSVIGYNAGDGIYTYDAFNSMGDAEHAKDLSTPIPGSGRLVPRSAPKTRRAATSSKCCRPLLTRSNI